MKSILNKELIFSLIILVVLGLSFATKAHAAASLTDLSDQVTTSRPSPSATAAANLTPGIDTFAIIGDLGNYYLASDSAVIYGDTGETTESTLIVASMSAASVPWVGARTVYFTSTVGQKHHRGNALTVNVTATHIIKIVTNTAIENGGKIVINFPGTGSNIASPSATTFSFNKLVATSVLCNPTTACSSGTTVVSAPNITLTTTAPQAGGTAITIAIGCTGTVTLAGICSTYAPALINPTASVSQCSGSTCTADQWRITVSTTDPSNNIHDISRTVIGTIQAVQVQATIEPTLTFSIIGDATGTQNINSISASCGSVAANALPTTATFVNLGSLSPGYVSLANQTLQVTTNADAGYVITSTSSGRFINPSSGFFLSDANGGNGLTAVDTPVPAVITAGSPAFGIHACGARSGALSGQSGLSAGDIWVNNGTISPNTAKFSNPWNTGVNGFYATLASYTGGPISLDNTAVLYGATSGLTTPAGTYSNYFTYVATPTF